MNDTKAAPVITISDWLRALADASTPEGADDAVTIQELSAQLGRRPQWIRFQLADLQAKGDITITVVKVRRLAMSGIPVVVPAYVIRRTTRHPSPS